MKANIKELNLEEEAKINGGYEDPEGKDPNYPYKNETGPLGTGPLETGPLGTGPLETGPLGYPYQK